MARGSQPDLFVTESQSDLFGAEAGLWQSVNFLKTIHRAQVVAQGFAFVAKAVLREFKKCSNIRDA